MSPPRRRRPAAALISPAVLLEARNQLIDMGPYADLEDLTYDELVAYINDLTPADVVQAINRHYTGGWTQFRTDAQALDDGGPDLPPAA